ncbi:hypothetical protein FIBSPDRAFT_866069, partial [Athelia psychrophila]
MLAPSSRTQPTPARPAPAPTRTPNPHTQLTHTLHPRCPRDAQQPPCPLPSPHARTACTTSFRARPLAADAALLPASNTRYPAASTQFVLAHATTHVHAHLRCGRKPANPRCVHSRPTICAPL